MSSRKGKRSSEPLNNSAYYFFLTLFTNYAMHEIMNSRMFSLSVSFSLDVDFAYG
jgi:hypothetical protein